MAQKAYIIEGISGDILEHEPIASLIAEGFQVSSINAFDKGGKSMCVVLLSDGESSGGGGGSDSDYLAPPVFSPMGTNPTISYEYADSIVVTLTAEEGADIYYTNDLSNGGFALYEEPITLENDYETIYAYASKEEGESIKYSPVVAAQYLLSPGLIDSGSPQ